MTLEETIKEKAKSLGFDLVRIAKAEKLQKDAEFFEHWIKEGYAGSMEYLKKDPQKRGDPEKILPGVKSIICLGINYYQKRTDTPIQIARYASGRDYHKIIQKKLKIFCGFLNQINENDRLENNPLKNEKLYIDTGPVFERAFSEKSGMGFIGKNTCVITREFGSYIFLAEIFTTRTLTPDPPATWKGSCGTCRRCIDICPTKAIQPDRTIDSKKCISYLTIENRGRIPVKFREKIGTWLFGCDLCQEICPHNVRAQETKNEELKKVRIGGTVQDLKKILSIKNEQEFLEMFAGTVFMRAKYAGLIRNACIVAGNLKEKSLIPILKKLAKNKNPLIKEHAQWAVEKIAVKKNASAVFKEATSLPARIF